MFTPFTTVGRFLFLIYFYWGFSLCAWESTKKISYNIRNAFLTHVGLIYYRFVGLFSTFKNNFAEYIMWINMKKKYRHCIES